MAFRMEIESEVFGSCVGKTNVSVGMENGDAWLCCRWKYLALILGRQRWLKIGGVGGRWCQVLGGVSGALGVIKELKKPLWWRGPRRIRVQKSL